MGWQRDPQPDLNGSSSSNGPRPDLISATSSMETPNQQGVTRPCCRRRKRVDGVLLGASTDQTRSVRQRTFYVGNNMYSRCEVVAMEWLVQEVLNFQCFLPSIYNFLWFYLKAARASEEMEKTVKHLAVLAMLGHEQLSYWPSTGAASLVILVAVSSNQNATHHRVTETHVRTEDDDLHDCIKNLQGLLTFAS